MRSQVSEYRDFNLIIGTFSIRKIRFSEDFYRNVKIADI